MRPNIHSIIELVSLKTLEKAPVCCIFVRRGRSLALYKKGLKLYSEAIVAIFNYIISKINIKKTSYKVGQRLYSRTKRSALFLEKEIFVNEIKHFRVRVEGAPIKKAVILSESALQNEEYKALENNSKIETLL